MADVRAMLRAERAARAPPSSKPRKQAPAPAASSKKRKASDDHDDEDSDARKRARPQEVNKHVPEGFFDEREDHEEDEDEPQGPIPGFVPAEDDDPKVASSQPKENTKSESKPAQDDDDDTAPAPAPARAPAPADNDVDEAEWAAFQAFANSVPSKSALDALQSNATLEAAPLSAADAAAQAGTDPQQQQRSRRDEEIEGEKEDAAERLEEEFEVMENLEDRIRRLKEKRETLRRASMAEAEAERPALAGAAEPGTLKHETVIEEESDGGSDSDDADEFDGWRFGAS